MVTSVVRTVVPIVVGWLLSLGVVSAAGVTEADLTLAVTGLLTVVGQVIYYVVLRLVERHLPGAGWLLGRAVQPSYANAKTIPGDVVGR